MNQPLAEATTRTPRAQPGCERWHEDFMQTRLPILSRTRDRLRLLQQNKRDTIPRLCEEIIQDAGFTLNLIEQTNRVLKNRSKAPSNNLKHAALLLGVPYINTLVEELPCLEEHANQSAKLHLLQHYQRNYHAARQACSWLGNKPGTHQDEVFLCAMLQGAETINLWIAAPDVALQLQRSAADDPEMQTRVLGCSLDELVSSYAKHAHFPELYLSSIEQGSDPASQSLRLAGLIARQAEIDWYTDRIPELADNIAEITGWTAEQSIAHIHRTAVQTAREFSLPGLKPAAAGLLEYRSPKPLEEIVTTTQATAEKPSLPETPDTKAVQPHTEPEKKAPSNTEIYRLCVAKLKAGEADQPLSVHEVISTGMEALHQGLRLQRVSFLILNRDRDVMLSKYLDCQLNSPPLEKISLELKGNHLFSRLMKAPQCLWLNDTNREKYWPMLPAHFIQQTAARNFLAMPVFIGDKPVGMFYADNHGSNKPINEKHQQYFKHTCTLVGQALLKHKNR